MTVPGIERRAAVHAALGDRLRLAIVEDLMLSDRSPAELQARFGISSNLLAHHIDVLVGVGLVARTLSDGDRRRRYVRLVRDPLVELMPERAVSARRLVFVCTANSARSQFARAAWCTRRTDIPAASGGTRPAPQVHPGALRAAQTVGWDLHDAVPQPIPVVAPDDVVVTVCDRAHEEMEAPPGVSLLHWSIADPVEDGDFDAALIEVQRRVEDLSRHVVSAKQPTAEQEEP